MKCPYCAHLESKVVDSRPSDEGASIRRRRECLACHKRFTTYETMESLPLVVIKKDGSRQTFDKSKLLNGMLRACEKRPVPFSQLEGIANEIEQALQNEMDLTYMFVTHDLSVVKHISDHIMVMYLGESLEHAQADELFNHPLHPYTCALLSSIPEPDISMRNKKISVIKGEVVSPIDPKPGCRFAPRCEKCMEICTQCSPELKEVAPGHFVACHKYDQDHI